MSFSSVKKVSEDRYHCIRADGTKHVCDYDHLPPQAKNMVDQQTNFTSYAARLNQDQFLSLLSDKRSAILSRFNGAVNSLIGETPQAEIDSWSKQEIEARAFIADNNFQSPLLENLAQSRNQGETVLELSQKIIGNADAYAMAYGQLLGQYQSLDNAIQAIELLSANTEVDADYLPLIEALQSLEVTYD